MKSSLPPFLKSEKFLGLHLGLQRKHRSVEDKNTIATNVIFAKTTVTFIGCLLSSSLSLYTFLFSFNYVELEFHVENFFHISLGLECYRLDFYIELKSFRLEMLVS